MNMGGIVNGRKFQHQCDGAFRLFFSIDERLDVCGLFGGDGYYRREEIRRVWICCRFSEILKPNAQNEFCVSGELISWVYNFGWIVIRMT